MASGVRAPSPSESLARPRLQPAIKKSMDADDLANAAPGVAFAYTLGERFRRRRRVGPRTAAVQARLSLADVWTGALCRDFPPAHDDAALGRGHRGGGAGDKMAILDTAGVERDFRPPSEGWLGVPADSRISPAERTSESCAIEPLHQGALGAVALAEACHQSLEFRLTPFLASPTPPT